MKRLNQTIVVLFLVFLTISSYTLAKYVDKKTYVIGINDLKYKDMAPPVRSLGEELGSEDDDLMNSESNEFQSIKPERVFQASYDGQVHDFSFESKGIYAIQLYSGTSLFTDSLELKDNSAYLAAYIEDPENLQFYLGDHGTLEKPADSKINEVTEPKLGEASVLKKTGETQPLMKTDEEKSEINEGILTKILPDSPLYKLIKENQTNQQRNYQGKITVTYLGPAEELKTIERMNRLGE
ncbi:hypothetical protein [Candidatus Enterococcus ferrettii]|uniref:Uncharacterized protein n=1 Tax=Candidatus Enterococcus ferrettii TaxID=2815324 RepID=A0ABV0EXD1_9ENTE|nr:hypothetical protein [Enterococcus sp. 665A]MBO1339457.1 hypothetical protein [Enterococcus sp. 665A]